MVFSRRLACRKNCNFLAAIIWYIDCHPAIALTSIFAGFTDLEWTPYIESNFQCCRSLNVNINRSLNNCQFVLLSPASATLRIRLFRSRTSCRYHNVARSTELPATVTVSRLSLCQCRCPTSPASVPTSCQHLGRTRPLTDVTVAAATADTAYNLIDSCHFAAVLTTEAAARWHRHQRSTAEIVCRIFMVALWNRADHYIFILSFVLSSFFFPRLISAVADWVSAILPHMCVWP